MCTQPRDLLKAVEYKAGKTCETLSADLLSKVSGSSTWADVTVQNVYETTWMDGTKQKLSAYINLYGDVCCGGAGRARFTDTENMCIDKYDYSPTAIAYSTYTCAQAARFILNEASRTQWSDVSCVDFAESARVATNPAGDRANMFSTLVSIGASCCGSQEKTRSLGAKVAKSECKASYNDELVVLFANTIMGYGKDEFTAEVQNAYIAAIASKVGVLESVVTIHRIKDGDKPAERPNRRLAGDDHAGHGHEKVSFDIEILTATDSLNTELKAITDALTDAEILAAFKAELTAAGETIPEHLTVTKFESVTATATKDSMLGAILGGIIGALVVFGALYYFCVHKKKGAPAEKNVQLAEITGVESSAFTVVAVFSTDKQQVQAKLAGVPGVAITATHRNQFVITGPTASVQGIVAKFKSEGVQTKSLDDSYTVVAVFATPPQVQAKLVAGVVIAANTPTQIVISGPTALVQGIVAKFAAEGVQTKPLNTPIAGALTTKGAAPIPASTI